MTDRWFDVCVVGEVMPADVAMAYSPYLFTCPAVTMIYPVPNPRSGVPRVYRCSRVEQHAGQHVSLQRYGDVGNEPQTVAAVWSNEERRRAVRPAVRYDFHGTAVREGDVWVVTMPNVGVTQGRDEVEARHHAADYARLALELGDAPDVHVHVTFRHETRPQNDPPGTVRRITTGPNRGEIVVKTTMPECPWVFPYWSVVTGHNYPGGNYVLNSVDDWRLAGSSEVVSQLPSPPEEIT